MATRKALRVRNSDLPVSCRQQLRDQGGYDLGTAGDYMLWITALPWVLRSRTMPQKFCLSVGVILRALGSSASTTPAPLVSSATKTAVHYVLFC